MVVLNRTATDLISHHPEGLGFWQWAGYVDQRENC